MYETWFAKSGKIWQKFGKKKNVDQKENDQHSKLIPHLAKYI
jgi:hypothetical protein